VGDKHQCPLIHPYLVPHVGGPVKKGSHTVFVNGLPVARVGDPMKCVAATAKIKKGAKSILVDNKPMAYLGSATTHHGKIVKGSHNVAMGVPQPIDIPKIENKNNKMNLHINLINEFSSQPSLKIQNIEQNLSKGNTLCPLNEAQLSSKLQIKLFDFPVDLYRNIDRWQPYSKNEYRLHIKQGKLHKKVDLEPEYQLVILESKPVKKGVIEKGHYNLNSCDEKTLNWFSGIFGGLLINGMPAGGDMTKLWAEKDSRQFLLDFIHGGDFYVKEAKGVPYVIFRGSRKLRNNIKGTRYRYDNPKIKAIKTQALLKTGKTLDAVKEISKDSVFGVLIVATIDTIEYLTSKNNKEDWVDLVSKIFADVIKLILAVIIAQMLVAILAAVAEIIFDVAVGVIAVVAVSIIGAVVMGITLDAFDDKIDFSKKLDMSMHNSVHWIEHECEEAKGWLKHVEW
jgi:uncharacterized Zn-binding protein involved in type VI secretion